MEQVCGHRKCDGKDCWETNVGKTISGRENSSFTGLGWSQPELFSDLQEARVLETKGKRGGEYRPS